MCRHILLPRNIKLGMTNTIECVPISSCGIEGPTTPITITWRRVLIDGSSVDITGNFTLPDGLQVTPTFDNVDGVTNAILNITMADVFAAGEYQAVHNNTVLYTFVLYRKFAKYPCIQCNVFDVIILVL